MTREQAATIVDAIIHDLNDRRGLGIQSCCAEIQEQIREAWIAIILASTGVQPSLPWELVRAALKWERAHTNWSTAERDTKDTHRVTPQSEMRDAEKELVEAVKSWIGR